jgi:Gpi18-like mannosyltransferase
MTGVDAASGSTTSWSRNERLSLAAVVVAGVLIRLILLPTDGLRGDIDQFVAWTHTVAVSGLATLYNGTPFGPVAFGPVMAYVWAILTALQPAFATVTDSADPGIRALMKVPASLADLGLAAIVVWALRDRPRWAVIGAAAILLHPAVIYVSAWWGQYESIFLLFGLGAVVAAVNGRNGVAAALVAAALLTKPQALAFILPFATWFWASGYATGGVRGGVIGLVRAGLIGVATLVVLWLPFLANAGPIRYVEGLGMYQTDVFRILSLNAWNAWWLLQEAGGGHFLADDTAVLGPLTPRHLGYVATAVLSLVVVAAIVRSPRPAVLILGVTASVMVVFTFMTQMHERYAYAALIIPVLLLSRPPVRWWWLAFSVVFFLNLVAAVPPSDEIGRLLPVFGPLGVAGAIAMTALCLGAVVLTQWASLDEPGTQRVADAPGR